MEPNKFSGAAELPEPMIQNQGDVLSVPSPETAQQPQPTFSQAQPEPAPPVQSVVPTMSAVDQSSQSQSNAAVSTLIADDTDLIEKEWVIKAKAIVAQTAHDPNLQTKEVVKVRAEYLKKRYNKNLKLEES